LIIRYQDDNDADTYYDHPMLVRVFPAAAHPAYTLSADECYQNPYPVSYGGCASSVSADLCKMYVSAFDYVIDASTHRTDIYIGG
jgi:hypothetical protein